MSFILFLLAVLSLVVGIALLYFAIIVVKSYIVHSQTEGNKAIQSLQMFFRMPVVLMSIDNGRPTYFGRRDIVNFMSHIELYQIPWKKYTIR